MGFGPLELFLILVIVLVLFGAKKLRNIGGDLGGAIKNFKTAMGDEENKTDHTPSSTNKESLEQQAGNIIEGSASVENHKQKV